MDGWTHRGGRNILLSDSLDWSRSDFDFDFDFEFSKGFCIAKGEHGGFVPFGFGVLGLLDSCLLFS